MSNEQKLPAYYMSIEHEERLNHGPYESREDAAAEAPEIRAEIMNEQEFTPYSFTVCKIIPSHENAIKETSGLPFWIRDFIEEWVNENVEGGTEDGVLQIKESADEILKVALEDILTNHSKYYCVGAPTECVETKFDEVNDAPL